MATKIALAQLVTYRLTAADVAGILERRASTDSQRRRMDRAAQPSGDGQEQPAAIPAIGAAVALGDTVAAIVCKVNVGTSVNLRLVLDGFDGYWVQGVQLGTAAGTWSVAL